MSTDVDDGLARAVAQLGDPVYCVEDTPGVDAPRYGGSGSGGSTNRYVAVRHGRVAPSIAVETHVDYGEALSFNTLAARLVGLEEPKLPLTISEELHDISIDGAHHAVRFITDGRGHWCGRIAVGDRVVELGLTGISPTAMSLRRLGLLPPPRSQPEHQRPNLSPHHPLPLEDIPRLRTETAREVGPFLFWIAAPGVGRPRLRCFSPGSSVSLLWVSPDGDHHMGVETRVREDDWPWASLDGLATSVAFDVKDDDPLPLTLTHVPLTYEFAERRYDFDFVTDGRGHWHGHGIVGDRRVGVGCTGVDPTQGGLVALAPPSDP
nr:hypothetical protein [uncultured bacterium]